MRGQGNPPAGSEPVALNIVVGDAAAGKAYFAAKCASCHSATGDLQGLAGTHHRSDAAAERLGLGRGRRARRPRRRAAAARKPVTVTVTIAVGSEGRRPARSHRRLRRRRRSADGTSARVRRDGDVPKVEINDPLEGHRKLLHDVHRQRHPRRDRLSGDPEMTFRKLLLTTASRASRCSCRAGSAAGPRSRSQAQPGCTARARAASIPRDLQAARRFVADLLGRLHGPALQHADADQPDERQEPHARVGRRSVTAGAGRMPVAAADSAAARWRSAARAPMIVGGEGTGEFAAGGDANIKGAILQVDGVLYCRAPDNVWAIDARDGRELWHYFWKTKGGTHIGSRGVGMWHNYLYFETPDNYLVSLDAKTGKERWHVEIADFNQQYFSTMAPIVVGNHVLVGTGNDLDAPGFLQSFDPETGKLQWKFYTVPMKPGDPGLDTWPSLEAARHGGGQVWIPGVYDPETKLYIFGTGNPTPGLHRRRRARATTSSPARSIAVNVDTGKMAWYFQTSPHDTHDWDSAQTPILIDGDDQRPAAQAGLDRRAQRLLLHRRSRHRRAHRDEQVRDDDELGEGHARERRARSEPREGSDDSWLARVAGRRRRHELAAAGVLAGHRPLLRAGEQRLQPRLPDRSGSARLDGPRRQADRRASDRPATT